MTDKTEEQIEQQEGPTEEQIRQLVAGLLGLDPEVLERQQRGDPAVEVAASLTYKHAPTEKCKAFFNNFGTHQLECAKMRGIDLWQNGPTITIAEAMNNRQEVDAIMDPANQPPGFDAKTLHTATYKQVAEDLADYVDAAIKRLAQGEETLSRCAVWDVSEGLTILMRGLRNLTYEPEFVNLQDDDAEPEGDGDPDPAV